MKSFQTLLIVLFVLLQTGCASYRPAALSLDTSPDNENIVRVGDEVRIEMQNGDSLEGEVLRLSATELVLGKLGNYGVVETVVGLTDIVSIESRYSPQGASIATSTVGVLVILTIALGAFATAQGGIGSN